MEPAHLPPPLDHIETKPFSFYPAIVGVECNEWEFRQANWSEILVANRRTHEEIWLSRRYFGNVSCTEDPFLIVGLTRELEYQGGMISPHRSRMLKMPASPRIASTPASGEAAGATKAFKGLRLDRTDMRIVRLMGIVVAFAILVYVGVVAATRGRIVLKAQDPTFDSFSSRDDRFVIVTRLGAPSFDRFKEVGTIQYEALTYPGRKCTLILMGADTHSMLYIGALDDEWRPIHYVQMVNGVSTEPLLRTIGKF